MAVNLSNIANLDLSVAKVYASIESKSLDLLSGFVLWYTAYAMKKPNQFSYQIGKKRMQPVSHPAIDQKNEKWIIGIMTSATIGNFVLMLYCRNFKNEIVRAHAQDHPFDVMTNSIGPAAALLAIRFYWWIDPVGAITIALYTMSTGARTVMENVWSLIGKTAPPDFSTKLTCLIWNHHAQIKHIATVRAYTFVEVDIVLPGNMLPSQAHDIGETLQAKLEQLPGAERAFVHVDFEQSHRHKRRGCMQTFLGY